MRLEDHPRERVKAVAFALFTDQSGPNILLGIFVSAALQAAIGMVPAGWAALAGAVWLVDVGIYAVLDDVRRRLEAERNRLLEPESRYYGIE